MLVSWNSRAQMYDRQLGDADTRRRDEYLDSVVHHSLDRMALRFHVVPRGRRIDSLVAGLRRHRPDTALCSGKKSRLSGTFRQLRKWLPRGSNFFFLRGFNHLK